MNLRSFEWKHPLAVPVLSLLLAVALLIGGYEYYTLYLANNSYAAQLAQLTEELSVASSTNQELSDAYTQEKARNDDFADQIKNISGTVGILDKLSKTDPQLLAKYSKIYFLNENYIPASLSAIPSKYTYQGTGSEKEYPFLSPILPHLTDMFDDAKDADVTLQVISSYRSFGEQAALKSSYRITYGSGANAFSADQGYSEHQLATTVDITTPTIGGTFTGFENTDAYAWLTKYAYKYGFVLSYPKDNTYYVFEPWHWRYVGINLATKLHDDKQYFYDLDQREINTYLVDFYDEEPSS